jgi:hypothetical protein
MTRSTYDEAVGFPPSINRFFIEPLTFVHFMSQDWEKKANKLMDSTKTVHALLVKAIKNIFNNNNYHC